MRDGGSVKTGLVLGRRLVTPLRNADEVCRGCQGHAGHDERHGKEETLQSQRAAGTPRRAANHCPLASELELRTEMLSEQSEEQLRASAITSRARRPASECAGSGTHFKAREIHDELGQACTAIKMDLALIIAKQQVASTPRQKVDATIHWSHHDCHPAENCFELRPRTLDDLDDVCLGMASTGIRKTHGISCRLACRKTLVLMRTGPRPFSESFRNRSPTSSATLTARK